MSCGSVPPYASRYKECDVPRVGGGGLYGGIGRGLHVTEPAVCLSMDRDDSDFQESKPVCSLRTVVQYSLTQFVELTKESSLVGYTDESSFMMMVHLDKPIVN